MNQDKFFGIPKSLARVLSLGSLIFLLFFILSSDFCWFNIGCYTGALIGPEIAVGGLATIALIAVLQIPVMPAIVAGVTIWAMLSFWF